MAIPLSHSEFETGGEVLDVAVRVKQVRALGWLGGQAASLPSQVVSAKKTGPATT